MGVVEQAQTLDLRDAAQSEAASLLAMLPKVSANSSEARLRETAIPTWLRRMTNEHGSARVFVALAAHARALGFCDFADELSDFADEERRHGMLCGAVATALGGSAIAPRLADAPYPTHPDAHTPLEALLRNVISVSCLSETIAVALIGAELEEMPAGPLADVLRNIWSDEIGHSRVGWRFLHEQAPALDEASRKSLCRYITQALEDLEAHEHAHLPIDSIVPNGGERYGLCAGSEARALMALTVSDVILPSLSQAGLFPT